VPPGFVVTTDTCREFFEAGKTLPPALKEEYMAALAKVRPGYLNG
jgi:pyruvate, orthophosphate dikinase